MTAPASVLNEHARRWRLVLGRAAEEESPNLSLAAADLAMDRALAALYESDRKGGLGSSCPNVARWLGDIRQYFPTSVVQVMQKDALDRLEWSCSTPPSWTSATCWRTRSKSCSAPNWVAAPISTKP